MRTIYTCFFLQFYRIIILHMIQDITYNNYIYKYNQGNLILKLKDIYYV